MSRKNGGIIGPANTPVGGLISGSASGVWRMNDLLDFVGNSQWPSAPQDIENSVRFNFDDDPRLARTLGTPTNADKYTFSAWVKRDKPTTSAQDYAYLISFDIGGTLREHIRFSTGGANDQLSWYIRDSGSTATSLTTSATFRDVSAWYHVCCAYDSTQSTSSNRQKIYINGTEITSFSSSGYVSQNQDSPINTSGHAVKIGSLGNTAGTTGNFSGYMAEIVFIDGQALDPTSFGEFDSTTGIWKPRKIGAQFGSGGAGNNGFYLDFKDSSSLGNDASGNNNDWTPSDLTSTDQATDTCVENFATLNPLAFLSASNGQISEGNTKFSSADASLHNLTMGNFSVDTGKWYWEVQLAGTINNYAYIGIRTYDSLSSASKNQYLGEVAGGISLRSDGYLNIDGSFPSQFSGISYGSGDIIGVGLDLDNNKIYWYENGTLVNTGGTTITNRLYAPGASLVGNNGIANFNFGNPAFSISSGNADANGFGNFEYSVPSGHFALNTSNLNTYG